MMFLVMIFLLQPISIFAQETKSEPSTKLEQFLSKKGKLIIKDSYEAGSLSGQYGTRITVGALTIYEPGKEVEKIRGLRIEIESGGKFERTNTSFLDMDEIESLSQAISYMLSLLDKWKGTHRDYTEVIFSTKGDFKLGFYQKDTELQAFAKSGVIGTATCYFPTSDLPKFKTIIDKGRELLKK